MNVQWNSQKLTISLQISKACTEYFSSPIAVTACHQSCQQLVDINTRDLLVWGPPWAQWCFFHTRTCVNTQPHSHCLSLAPGMAFPKALKANEVLIFLVSFISLNGQMSSCILHLFCSGKCKILIKIHLFFSRFCKTIGLGNGISTNHFHVEIPTNSFAFLLQQDSSLSLRDIDGLKEKLVGNFCFAGDF